MEFGRFKVVPHRRELLADGQPVELGGRLFDLLLALINARGTIVGKNDLIRGVWAGRVVEENSLTVGIATLRKALGPNRDLIRTVSGRGYQFVGEIRECAPDAVPVVLTNLPAPMSALIGREAALSEVGCLVLKHRLLTLTGVGGIGKTRLAVEAARTLLENFANGVWIADLAPLNDPELVPVSVALALGLNATDTTAERLATILGAQQILVVLDNCEHVIDLAARTASNLMRAGQNVYVLCTSREPLRVDDEWVYNVQPLDVPEEDAVTDEEILATSAVKLFITRACAANPLFRLDPSMTARLVSICRRLDGMPLAIELAAARAGALGMQEVAARLDERFRLLTGGRRNALPRHQTLRATFDWSYELLPEGERLALCRLGVFAGEFVLEAARHILTDPDDDNSATQVLEDVASLVNKSLLTMSSTGAVTLYRMLETTRAYALDRLVERGELQRYARRHAQYYLAALKLAEAEWRIRSVVGWLSDYTPLMGDGRVALDWAFSADGDPTLGAELTIALSPLWIELALMEEWWINRVTHALRIVVTDPRPNKRLEMQLNAVLAAALQNLKGNEAQGEAALNSALVIAEELDDRAYLLATLYGLWLRRVTACEFPVAHPFAQKFLSVAATVNDPSAMYLGEFMTAYVLSLMGAQTEARRRLDSIMNRKLSRLPCLIGHSERYEPHRAWRAMVLWLQGHANQAMRIAAQCVDAGVETGHMRTAYQIIGLLAWQVAVLAGDLVEAQRYIELLHTINERMKKQTWYDHWTRALDAALLIKRGESARGSRTLSALLSEIGKGNVKLFGAMLTLILAEGLSSAGDVAAALSVIDDALTESDITEVRLFMPEQLRLKGELILLAKVPNANAEAESCYARSLELARCHGALAWELRAATSLARLRWQQGRDAEATEIIVPVFDRFTEGFETVDLVKARELIRTLGSDSEFRRNAEASVPGTDTLS